MRKLSAAASALLLPLFAAAQQQAESLYRIYDTRTRTEITLEALADAMSSVDVIFFGEEHNDSVAHVLELRLLNALHERYHEITLSMEMFVSDDQLVLDEYLAGMITEKNLSSAAVLWPNYKDYRPLIEYAKSHQLSVLAANAPTRYTNLVTRHGLQSLGTLSKAAKALLAPLPIDTLTGPYYKKFAGLMGEHRGTSNLNIYQSQNLWDATMAFRISQTLKQRKARKILHLNGRFHSDEKLGTVTHFHRYAPKRTIKNISCFSHDSIRQPDWDRWQHLGDFVILTDPAVPRTY